MLPAISRGWPAILSSLKSVLETGQPLEIPYAALRLATDDATIDTGSLQARDRLHDLHRSTPEKVWQALTSAEFSRQYFFGNAVEVGV